MFRGCHGPFQAPGCSYRKENRGCTARTRPRRGNTYGRDRCAPCGFLGRVGGTSRTSSRSRRAERVFGPRSGHAFRGCSRRSRPSTSGCTPGKILRLLGGTRSVLPRVLARTPCFVPFSARWCRAYRCCDGRPGSPSEPETQRSALTHHRLCRFSYGRSGPGALFLLTDSCLLRFEAGAEFGVAGGLASALRLRSSRVGVACEGMEDVGEEEVGSGPTVS